ncbi:hypothetical protein AVEN_147753-1, partial [Araneus ventricosus]
PASIRGLILIREEAWMRNVCLLELDSNKLGKIGLLDMGQCLLKRRGLSQNLIDYNAKNFLKLSPIRSMQRKDVTVKNSTIPLPYFDELPCFRPLVSVSKRQETPGWLYSGCRVSTVITTQYAISKSLKIGIHFQMEKCFNK